MKKKMECSPPLPLLGSEFPEKIGTIYPRLNICFHAKNGRMGRGGARIEKKKKQTLEGKSRLLTLFACSYTLFH
jgi:hypothetical protein